MVWLLVKLPSNPSIAETLRLLFGYSLYKVRWRYGIAEKNQLIHIPPHLMFYAPYATDKDIGSPPPAANMPHLIRAGQPDAYIIVVPGAATHPSH
jgi:hypothetical protein